MQRYDYAVEVFNAEQGNSTYFGNAYENGIRTDEVSYELPLEQATVVNTWVNATALLNKARKCFDNVYFSIKRLPYAHRKFRNLSSLELHEIAMSFLSEGKMVNNIISKEVEKRSIKIKVKYKTIADYEVLVNVFQCYKNDLWEASSRHNLFEYSLTNDETNNCFTLQLNTNMQYSFRFDLIDEVLYYARETSLEKIDLQYPAITEDEVNKMTDTTNDSNVEEKCDIDNKEESMKNFVNISPRSKYNLPKYVHFDRAESRNRKKIAFQVQVKNGDKIQKTYKSTVKDAVQWVYDKKVKELNQWTLREGAEYLLTYKEEMENGPFIMSTDPVSPSVAKINKKRKINKLNAMINSNKYTMEEIKEFIRMNRIEVNFS